MGQFIAVGVALFIAWMAGWAVFYEYRLMRLDLIARRFEGSLKERHQNEATFTWLMERTAEFATLIRGAGVEDAMVPFARPVSPMHVETGHASALRNWLMLNEDCYQWTRRAIAQARGVYKDRRLQSINPFHWFLMLFSLPVHAIRWVGGNPDGSLSRALTLLWAAVVAASVIAGLVVAVRDLMGIM